MNDKKYDGVYYETRKVTDIKDLIETSVELYGEHAAYLEKSKETDKFEPITYDEVKSDMDAFGTKLIDLGLKGKRVAVIGETSYKWLLTYFTVVSGVGVIVPLDKNLPPAELMGLIERSKASAIVYSDKCRDNIAELFDDPKTIEHFISMGAEEDSLTEHAMDVLIAEGRKLLEAGNTEYLDASIDPDQMSTLLFTSGTTGMAKGVMLSHRNIVSNCYEMSKFFNIPEPGIVLSILPVHHVYEMTCDIMTTFYQGKTIAICEGIKYIQKNMEETKANVMLGVPLVFEKMYKGMWKQAKRRGEEKKLRRAIDLSKRLKLYNNKTIIRRLFKAIHQSFGGAIEKFVVGGAAADPYIIEEFEAMGLPIIQGYGMSENAPIICLNPDRYRKYDAVGKPLPGTKVRIIDQDEDGIGEIIVKGPSVMLGYYENEEATKETLINGWLHTGDLGYIDDDGFVHITGRAKTVIVTKGGKNIFPEEVEAVLLENELIQEVIVHGVTDDRVGNVMITADIYPNYDELKKQKGDLGESGIYHFYRDLMTEYNKGLPPYKQVKRVNIRKEPFVKTTTGKIKRFGNKLSGEDRGAMDEHDVRRMEESRARELVDQIKMSDDALIVSKDIRPVTCVKDLVSTSLDMFEGNDAFIRKFEMPDGEPVYKNVTYKQMKADMDGLGTALLNKDLGGGNVAIIGRNGYKWQISYLAVISGVGTVVPIECDLGEDELKRRLQEAEVKVVIFEDQLRDTIKSIKASGETKLETLIEYDYIADEAKGSDTGAADIEGADEKAAASADGVMIWDELVEQGKNSVSQGDRQFIDKQVKGADIGAIIYTSGETGKARSVALTQANIAYGVVQAAAAIRIDPSDIVYSALPAHIVYELTCGLLLPIYRGATVVSSRNGAYTGAGSISSSAIASTASAAAMAAEMKETHPTMLVVTAKDIKILQKLFEDTVEERRGSALIYKIMDVNKTTRKVGLNLVKPFARSVRELVGGKLRKIITGGSKVSKETMEYMRMFGVTALQSYWLTECATIAAVDPEDRKLVRFGSCGHLVPGMEVKILNKGRDGMGEICLKGANVMQGYYKDEKATEAAKEGGWLHTGDRGFIDDDNFIYITGRMSDEDGAETEDGDAAMAGDENAAGKGDATV